MIWTIYNCFISIPILRDQLTITRYYKANLLIHYTLKICIIKLLTYVLHKVLKHPLFNTEIISISIFGTNKFMATDNTSIIIFLLRIAHYIRNIKVFEDKLNNFYIIDFGYVA